MRNPATGEQILLPILYQDAYMVAVSKSTGLLVHRTQLDPRERIAALQVVRDQVGRSVFPVHRLDKPTSGVLLFGLSAEIGTYLTDVFSRGEAQKTYVAIVRGWLDDTGVVDTPIGDLRDYTTSGLPGAPKEALSEYRRLAKTEIAHPVGRYETARYSLGAIYPKTGKRHQVRRHLKRIGHPVVGDHRHGDRDHNRFFQSRFQSSRLLLSAMELTVPHPVDGRRVTITDSLDPDFLSVVEALGWLDAVPPAWSRRSASE